ncbi:MAG: flavodoxin family protein [Candidatus Thorarchaeota archaeon]|nr:flavodoxin family protein [Candidatus Thorarchaeota archaeon]
MVPYENKHVLGIVGSPRIGGNTETLVDTILASAVERGASSDKVILTQLDIAPCQACNACRRTGSCIHEDDMEKLVSLMEKSDVWILGTPIYWWGPTAQFKTFLDRWYGVDQRHFQGKQIIAAIPMGGKDDHYARHTVGMIKDICNYLGMQYIETVIAPGMNGRGSVRESSRAIESARLAGMRIMDSC